MTTGCGYKDLSRYIDKIRFSKQEWLEPDCKRLGLKGEVRNRGLVIATLSRSEDKARTGVRGIFF